VPVVALVTYALLNLFYLWPRRRHGSRATDVGTSNKKQGASS
jgi:hypothetical protein